MKNFFPLLARIVIVPVLFLCCYSLQAQKLWCQAFNGGVNSAGTLSQLDLSNNTFTKLYDFVEATGSSPMGSVMQASNGKVYATCVNGGCDSSCVIYCYDPTTNTYTNLWSFDIVNGDFPMSGVIEVSPGVLLGVASAGGSFGAGVMYTMDTRANTNVYTPVAVFDSVAHTGFSPCGSPMQAASGKIYGLTSGYDFYYNQVQGYGGIYSFDLATNTITGLYQFTGVNDGFPFGSLVEHNGILYGLTSGTPQYAPREMQYIFPALTQIQTRANNGNVFSYNPATQTYTSLYTFDAANGSAPYGSLLATTDGKLYGMTSAGGTYNLGTIFSYDIATSAFRKLYDFDGPHGANPMGDLMQTNDGYLYGTTRAGGTDTFGVAFRFNPTNGDYRVMANFDNLGNGSSPLGGTFAVVNTEATGIAPITKPEDVSVFPQPAHNSLTVTFAGATATSAVITLTDVDGRNIWGPQTKALNNAQLNLDLSNLETGVYFLQAATGNDVITKKIVRQ